MAALFSYYTAPDPHAPRPEIKLAELVGLLSHALDMTEGQPPGHSLRSCWIGMQVGSALGLAGAELSDLYFTLMLKDLGCSSNAARICALYLTDDIQFKRDFKKIDGSLSAALRFVFAKTGPDEGLSERISAIVNILRNGGQIANDLIETRCHRGADIAAKMRFSAGVQAGILSLDEHWDGTGKPEQRSGHDIPVNSNIALLAQVADVFFVDGGSRAARAEVRRRHGTWFDPRLVEAFETVSCAPEFWTTLASPGLEAQVFGMSPATEAMTVDEGWLDDIADGFSQVVDAKSPFTADHSRRVTLYADMIGQEMALTGPHRRWLRRSALLHDLGKLAISNRILDKPGKPDAEEWAAIRTHSWHSERILERIGALRDLAPVAGAHHERLDGGGYPGGLTACDLGLEVRILSVADVFDALSADRPYRAAMPLEKVWSILEGDVGTAFDADCVAALKSAMQRLQKAA